MRKRPTRGAALGVLLWVVALIPSIAQAAKLKITSNPSGATVEFNGVVAGTTPYEEKVPGGFFKTTKTVFGKRLGTPLVARVSLEGYVTKELELTYGPMAWIALNGTFHGYYWLLKTDHFHFELEEIGQTFTGTVETVLGSGIRGEMRPELPVERVIELASPAVLTVRGSSGVGTGFLVTETGVIATNAHVVRGRSSTQVVTASGEDLTAGVVHIDPDLDLALLKVEGSGLPHLRLADVSSVRPGQTVVAIGNPAKGISHSVTRGIVSAVGQRGGNAIWVQTDAAINPGNSGGPLLNAWGEVVGVTTRKEFLEGGSSSRPLEGIGFALSSRDLMNVLLRYYPNVSFLSVHEASNREKGTGTLEISSDPDGAEIYVDDKYVGNTPSVLRLPAGSHALRLELHGFLTWEREIEVLEDSDVTVKGMLETPESELKK